MSRRRSDSSAHTEFRKQTSALYDTMELPSAKREVREEIEKEMLKCTVCEEPAYSCSCKGKATKIPITVLPPQKTPRGHDALMHSNLGDPHDNSAGARWKALGIDPLEGPMTVSPYREKKDDEKS